MLAFNFLLKILLKNFLSTLQLKHDIKAYTLTFASDIILQISHQI